MVNASHHRVQTHCLHAHKIYPQSRVVINPFSPHAVDIAMTKACGYRR
jgi:hypothetical protein